MRDQFPRLRRSQAPAAPRAADSRWNLPIWPASRHRTMPRSGSADAAWRLVDFDGLVGRGHHDLQDLEVVGILEYRVRDPRGLNPAASLAHQVLAVTFEFIAHPSLEHVHHLKLHIVKMTLGDVGPVERAGTPGDMRFDHAPGCRGHAEVAVDGVRTQSIALEILIRQMTDREFLTRPFHVLQCIAGSGHCALFLRFSSHSHRSFDSECELRRPALPAVALLSLDVRFLCHLDPHRTIACHQGGETLWRALAIDLDRKGLQGCDDLRL